MSTSLGFNIQMPPLRDGMFSDAQGYGTVSAQRSDVIASRDWRNWLETLPKTMNRQSITVVWGELSFVGSNITSILTRNHADLQNLNTASYYHLTQANHTDLTDGGETTLHAHKHNLTTDIQGGSAGSYYHFTQTQHTDLTDAGDSTLHFHATDRARANHTGTQTASTISDFSTAAQALIDASIETAKEKIEYNEPVNGFSYTIANATNVMVFKPAGTLATGTITMPATPANNQVVRIASTQELTALTHSPNAGQTLNGALTTILANGSASWVYRSADTSWYRVG